MKKTLHRLAMLAAALAVTGVCLAGAKPGGKKITLKQKYVPGNYLQTISMEVDQVAQVGGHEIRTQITLEYTIGVRISKPDKTGAKKMTWEYKRIKQTIATHRGKMSYDSAAPKKGDRNLGKVIGPLTKAKITIIIGPDDIIKTVTGMGKVWDELAKKDPVLAGMRTSMGNKMVKDMAEKVGQYLPGKPVAVGEEWVNKNDLDVPMLGKVKVEMKCKLKSIKAAAGEKRAVISVTGKHELAAIRLGGTTVRKLVITMTGENKLNVDNPMLSTTTLTQTASVEVVMPDQRPGGQFPVMEMKSKTKIVMKVVKAPPPKEKPAKATK